MENELEVIDFGVLESEKVPALEQEFQAFAKEAESLRIIADEQKQEIEKKIDFLGSQRESVDDERYKQLDSLRRKFRESLEFNSVKEAKKAFSKLKEKLTAVYGDLPYEMAKDETIIIRKQGFTIKFRYDDFDVLKDGVTYHEYLFSSDDKRAALEKSINLFNRFDEAVKEAKAEFLVSIGFKEGNDKISYEAEKQGTIGLVKQDGDKDFYACIAGLKLDAKEGKLIYQRSRDASKYYQNGKAAKKFVMAVMGISEEVPAEKVN